MKGQGISPRFALRCSPDTGSHAGRVALFGADHGWWVEGPGHNGLFVVGQALQILYGTGLCLQLQYDAILAGKTGNQGSRKRRPRLPYEAIGKLPSP